MVPRDKGEQGMLVTKPIQVELLLAFLLMLLATSKVSRAAGAVSPEQIDRGGYPLDSGRPNI